MDELDQRITSLEGDVAVLREKYRIAQEINEEQLFEICTLKAIIQSFISMSAAARNMIEGARDGTNSQREIDRRPQDSSSAKSS